MNKDVQTILPNHDQSHKNSINHLTLDYVKHITITNPLAMRHVNSNSMSILHRACHQGAHDIVKYLISLDCQANEINPSFSTSPSQLTDQPQCPNPDQSPSNLLLKEIIQFLLNLQDVFGRTALMMAISAKHCDIASSLLSYYERLLMVHCDFQPTKPLSLGQIGDLKKYPHLGINLRDARGQTALMIATRKSQFYIVKQLLQLGADPNVQDDQMRTSLHYLCSRRFLTSNMITNKRNESNITDQNNEQANVVAYQSLEPNLVPKDEKNDHQSPKRSFSISRILLDPEFVEQISQSVLLLVQSGIDLLLSDIRGNTAVHFLINTDHFEIMKNFFDTVMELSPKQLRKVLIQSNLARETPLQMSSKISPSASQLVQSINESLLMTRFRKKGIEHLQPKHILEWLNMIGYPQYSDYFFRNDVSGSVLLRLDNQTLKTDLNVQSFGHRESILKAIRTLFANISSYTTQIGYTPSVDENQLIAGECTLLKDASKWEITIDDLVFHEVIGCGFFGKVHRATWRNLQVAIKTIYHRQCIDDAKKNLVYKEIAILSQVRHPNVINFLGFVRTKEGYLMIVTELMSNGSLYNIIRTNLKLVEFLRERIVMDIACGMAYLHSRNILHRDLSTRNLLLDNNYMVKISDFGSSRIKDETNAMSALVGFLAVMAPEVFRGESYSEKADVFSFGIVLYEILTGNVTPQLDNMPLLSYANIVANQNYRPSWPPELLIDGTLDKWRQLTEDCWSNDADQRPFFQDIVDRVQKFSSKPSTPIHPLHSSTLSSHTPRINNEIAYIN